MKILLISSVALRTPPLNYGGLERVVYDYAVGLSKRGHDVHVAAAVGSPESTDYTLIETLPSWDTLSDADRKEMGKSDKMKMADGEFSGSLWNAWRVHEEISYEAYKDLLEGFDIVGDHSWSKWSYMSKKDEIIATLHSLRSYNNAPPRLYKLFTCVSNGHARQVSKELRIPIRRIWNPVDISKYPLQKEKGERVLSLNRILANKGIHRFVNLIEQMKIKGDIAGDDSLLVPDLNYVNQIKQRCAQSAWLIYHGLVDEAKKLELLQNAKCVVALKDGMYEEVFGLMAVEAMACGTPVIAMKSWGFDDIIEHGKSGYIVEKFEDIPKFIAKTGEISPENCRKRAEMFDVSKASAAYENLMQRVKDGSRW